MTGELYDGDGRVTHVPVLGPRPGHLVCLVDAEFNQLTPWAEISTQWLVKWPDDDSRPDARAVRYLMRDRAGERFRSAPLDIPVVLSGALTVELDLWPGVGRGRGPRS